MLIRELSECWLDRLKPRKRKPIKPASLAIFSSYVSNHVNPLIGGLEVETFQSKQTARIRRGSRGQELGAENRA